jgi:hypothetical protein
MASSGALPDQIREILLNDRDPSNAARFEASCGEYDRYVNPLAELIRSGADEAAIVEYLHDRELESMCFPALGTSHLKRIARKLTALGAS